MTCGARSSGPVVGTSPRREGTTRGPRRPPPVRVGEVAADVAHDLRRAVLRPGGGDVVWPGDDDPATFHLAARNPAGRVVGVVRFSPAPCPWRPETRAAWQLRGMATESAVRGSGAGRALLAEGLARVAARGGDLVWCDARTTAARFYQPGGFPVGTGADAHPG